MRTMVAWSKPYCATTRQATSAISSRRCSWSTILGMAPPVRGLQVRELRAYRRVHRRGFPARGIHVQVQLLRAGNERLIATAMQAVKQPHALVIDLQDPRCHVQWLPGAR